MIGSGEMTTEKKYALWLMPEGSTYDLLKREIASLCAEFSAPMFEPHITLLGGIVGQEEGVISKAKQFADLIDPFVVTLEKIDFLEEYYRCLFLRVGEDQWILEANLKARDLFNRQSDDRFMPHLSLLYGELPRHRKKEITMRIGDSLKMSFSAERVHLFSTAGRPWEWYGIEDFSLKGGSKNKIYR